MTFVITDACIDVKDKTCLDACPVDCIYEGGRTLYRSRRSTPTTGCPTSSSRGSPSIAISSGHR
jgi:hypothetical protein